MKKSLLMFFLIIGVLFTNTTRVLAVEDETTPSGIPLAELNDFIDEYVSQYIGKSTPGAAVAVIDDGKIIFSKGYGYADVENKIPVSASNTVFEYGSISKLFVYTTIMRLVEDGKIDLKADIRNYLPNGFLKRLKYDEPITMLDVMNHTTGFEDYLFDVVLVSKDHLTGLKEALLDCQPAQVYRPGTVVAYSNYAVALASYIAEEMLGQSYYDYLMQTIFLPLGMNLTSAHPTLDDKRELLNIKAQGYYANPKGGFYLGKWSYIPLYPVGSINGTVEDLARFAMAFMPNDKEQNLLFDKNETLYEMLSQTNEMGSDVLGFAHGFIEYNGEFRGVGHGGNTAYFSSQVNIVPEKRFGVIVLTNTASEMDISSGLTEALIGKKDKKVTVADENLPSSSEVEGTYVTARRSHSTFLEVYGYLSLLKVKAIDSNKIELNMAGQKSILVQTRPYVYERIEADGIIFKYHFDTVYFEMVNGKVRKMSGDYLPLTAFRTLPWLTLNLVLLIVSGLYFIGMPIVLLFKKLVIKKKTKEVIDDDKKVSKISMTLLLLGTTMLLNNLILIARMMVNNYRSFEEMRMQLMMNYPLSIVILSLITYLIVNLKNAKATRYQKIFSSITIFLLLILMILLINWKFFNL